MKVYKSSDNISVLGLTTRSCGALHAAGIHTVGEMLTLTRHQIRYLPRIGTKSAQEIFRICDMVRSGTECLYIEDAPSADNDSHTIQAAAGNRYYPDAEGQLHKDVPITELPLPPGTISKLLSAGIECLSELQVMSEQELEQLPAIGPVRAEQLYHQIIALQASILDPATIYPRSLEAHQAAVQLLRDLCLLGARNITNIYQKLIQAGEKFLTEESLCGTSLLSDEYYCSGVLRIPEIQEQILLLCRAAAGKRPFGISDDDLLHELPEYIVSCTGFADLLEQELSCGTLYRNEDGLIQRCYPGLDAYLQSLPNTRDKEILCFRLSGNSYIRTAEQFNISEGRVRQSCQKLLQNRPKLHEDRYSGIFQTYRIPKESFIQAFGISRQIYYYLKTTYKKGTEPIRDIDEDIYPESIARALTTIQNQTSWLDVNGKHILCDRQEIIRHLIMGAGTQSITIQELSDIYHEFLTGYGLIAAGQLAFNATSVEEALRKADYVLSSKSHRIRYYELGSRDFSDFFQTLDLQKYRDLEITSLKIFKDNRAIMAAYDIRDEYELHNLLKKLRHQLPIQNITLGKMPVICFGHGDRVRQMENLLYQMKPPIAIYKVYERFEESFGFKPFISAGILRRYYRRCLSGEHIILQPQVLSDEVRERMRSLLTEDFYYTRDILAAFNSEFPYLYRNQIDDTAIRELGFLPYINYAVSAKYANARDYFRQFLHSRDRLDLRNPELPMYDLPIFTKTLYSLENEYKLIETGPHKLVSIRVLEQQGIRMADIAAYCNSIFATVGEGEYFTAASLRRQGCRNPFERFGYDDWFCSSLLARDPRFRCQYLASGHLLMKGRSKFTLQDFMMYISETNHISDSNAISNIIRSEYGLHLDRR